MMTGYRIYVPHGSTDNVLYPLNVHRGAHYRDKVHATTVEDAIEQWEEAGVFADMKDGDTFAILNTGENGGLIIHTIRIPEPAVTYERVKVR